MIKADLHIHSNCSDGSDTIKELRDKIISQGLNIIALTDHDTISGIKELGEILPKDIKFINGIELTCLASEIKCHILGYFINSDSKELTSLIEKGKLLRKNKLETRIKYLKDNWNIELTQEEKNWLYTRKSVVKTHIANILVKRGLEKDNLSAMRKYLDGCKAGDTRFDGKEAIDTINLAGGISVWAHPLGGEGEKHISEEEFKTKLNKMIGLGIQGLECYYSRYSKDEIKLLIKYANENNLYITGGSDYHGTNKDIPLYKLNQENIPIEASELTILNIT